MLLTDIEEIDDTDVKIIKDLLVDSRKSFALIAKECDVSIANISTHYSKLEKKRIIVGSTLQLDYKQLGYNSVCDISIQCERSVEEKLLEYIRTMPNIYGAYKSEDPTHNIKIVAILKDLTELDQTKDIIKKSSFITDLKVQIWTDIKNYPENLHLNSVPCSALVKPTSSNISIDDTDLKLIKALSSNSRASFHEISSYIGASIDTAARRYKRLVNHNVIKPCIQLDLSKLGYKAVAKFNLSFSSQNDTESVIKRLTQIRDSYLVIKTSGNFDLRFSVILRDLEQFLHTRREIESIAGISKLESIISSTPFPFPTQCQYISTF